MDIRKALQQKEIILCDGAMGTMMQKYCKEPGLPPIAVNFAEPEVIERIHREYYEAGSHLVTANTFGADRRRCKEAGYTVEQVVKQALGLARKAAEEGEGRLVALDISSIGEFLEPLGDLSPEEAYDIFAEIVDAGVNAGADLIMLETFMDVYEAEIAARAARDRCDLPLFCSVTFQESGRTLMGADPKTVVQVLEATGADAIGLNCSVGPRQMLPTAKEFLACSGLPILAQPNAGMPRLVDRKAVYDVGPEEFAEVVAEMAAAGVAIVGGCCGTSPEYIRCLAGKIGR